MPKKGKEERWVSFQGSGIIRKIIPLFTALLMGLNFKLGNTLTGYGGVVSL